MDDETVPSWEDPGLVFNEPWQGRASGLAREWAEGVEGGEFRADLAAALAEDPKAMYFEFLVGALESAALASGRVAADELDDARLTAATYAVTDPDHGNIQVLSLPVDDGNRVWAAPLFGVFEWGSVSYLEAYWGSASTSPAAGVRAFDRHERLLVDVEVERVRLRRLLSDVLFLPLVDSDPRSGC